MRAVLTFLALAAGLFLALAALLYLRQESLIFFPVRTDPALGREWRPHRIEIPSGDALIEGWWAENPAASTPFVVLYFGGNAEDVLYTLATARRLAARRVLATNYRGYGGSSGRPGQAALFADALAVYDYAARQEGVDPGHIVVMGRSLGSAVAVYLAAQRPVKAAILVTPFDSLLAVARRHYPFVPVRGLLKHPFPADRFARDVHAPALMLAGERDGIIPPVHAERLLAAWAGDKHLHVLPRAGHNDIELHPDYYAAINEFLHGLSTGDDPQ